MPHLQLPDVRLFYTDQPAPGTPGTGLAGLPTLFVHGWLDTSGTWMFQLPHARRRCRVLTVDLRGHGRSEAPDSRYDAAELVGDLATFLTSIDTGPAVVVAHSMGASLASILAVEHPHLVAALILVDPDYGGEESERAALASVAAEPDPTLLVPAVARLVADRADAATSAVRLRAWRQRQITRMPPYVVARSLRQNIGAASSIRFRPAAEVVLARRRQPVLAFHRDPRRAELDRSLMRHHASRVVDVPRTGHWIHQEHPELVNADAEHWLRRLPHGLG